MDFELFSALVVLISAGALAWRRVGGWATIRHPVMARPLMIAASLAAAAAALMLIKAALTPSGTRLAAGIGWSALVLGLGALSITLWAVGRGAVHRDVIAALVDEYEHWLTGPITEADRDNALDAIGTLRSSVAPSPFAPGRRWVTLADLSAREASLRRTVRNGG